jgi:hypothetical protein
MVDEIVDRTNHSLLAQEHARRVADKYIPAVNRDVTRNDNAPPSGFAIAQAQDTTTEVSAFLKETPAVTSPAECKQGDAWIERVRINLQSMEDERKPRVEPLNAQLAAINEPYRLVRQPLEKIFNELKRRVTVFKNKIEAEREAEAARVRHAAEEAARIAAEAAAAADDAVACADVGECTDAGAAIFEAHQAEREAGKLDRMASRAENSVSYRNASIAGGKAMSMRTVTVINIADPVAAVKALCSSGVPEKLATAIRQLSVAFEEAYGVLPDGVTKTTERRM